jgi:hypothetical protein
MPNGYTVTPNVIPGNVTIQGNLNVVGDTLRVGQVAPYTRIGKADIDTGGWSFNQSLDSTHTRDDANYATKTTTNHLNNALLIRRTNPSGSQQVEAVQDAVYAKYQTVINTGNVAENTVYSKVLTGNLLGPSGGLLISFILDPTTQGAPVTTIRLRLDATQIASFTFNNTNKRRVDLLLANQANLSAQYELLTIFENGVAPVVVSFTSAVDTSATRTLTITAQSGATTDVQNFQSCVITLLNSFGPVL